MHSRPSPLEKECDHEEDICHFGRPEPRRWYCCSRGSGQRVIDLAVPGRLEPGERQLTVGGDPVRVLRAKHE